jgi:putative oxygen-independent coproporphyrinogen III oxidase
MVVMTDSRVFDVAHWMRPGTLQLSALPPLSLYVHLPWCLKKCPYCDFNSHAWNKESGDLPSQTYVQALLHDLELSLPLIWGRPIHSIFIGGGTPSLFPPEAVADLISGIRARLMLVPACEITLEANPGTFERDRFRAMRHAGVTRLSVGVQSFNNRHLSALGRVHDADQALAAASEAAACFDQWNLDLMYALPAQSRDDLREELKTLAALKPPHVSIYQLTLEPNTQFAKFPPSQMPDQDMAYDMLDDILAFAGQMGLERYEISAFASPSKRCWHNTNYWQFGDYLGIGAGAHSKISFAHRIVRHVRLRDPMLYLQQAASMPVAQCNEVKRDELPFEFMLNALRLVDGFPLTWFNERTGLPISALEPGLQTALNKQWLSLENGTLCPTPVGLDFLSEVQQLFL